MKNVFRFVLNIIFGVCDTILPKIDNSIQKIQSEFINDEPKISINWVRFAAALGTFILLILNLFKLVTIEQIIEILRILTQ
jgi:hypothetical protein